MTKLSAEQLGKWLYDPWGHGIAGDIVESATKKINEHIKAAEKEAAERMRERAANLAYNHLCSGDEDVICFCFLDIKRQIEALPLEEGK